MPNRRKNVDWQVTRKDAGKDAGSYSSDSAQLAVLMDIRDELRMVNATLLKMRDPAARKK